MKNSLNIANIPLFIDDITKNLSNNLNAKLIFSISSLLSMDYYSRLKSEPDIKPYIKLCITRLKSYLGFKVILSEDFSDAMTLFTVAITPEKSETENALSQQSQDIIIDSIIASNFSNLSSTEHETIRGVLKDLLNSKDGKELINLIVSDSQLFHSMIISASKNINNQQEINKSVTAHLNKILEQTKIENKQIQKTKGIFSKLTLLTGIIIAGSLGLVVGGLALPALIIPATIIAVKYGSKVGEQVATKVINNFSHKKNLLGLNEKDFLYTKNKQHEATISQGQVKNVAQKVEYKRENIISRNKIPIKKQSTEKQTGHGFGGRS